MPPEVQHITPSAKVSPSDLLALPLYRKAVLQDGLDATGAKVRTLYFGEHEITFEGPVEFDFAEGLIAQPSFIAREAMHWGRGCDWATASALLEPLLDLGIVQPPAANSNARPVAPTRRMGSPLPEGPASGPSRWTHAEQLSRDLCGRRLSPAHVELVIPVFRIAHAELDLEGRQVGEANVFPPALRMATETEWRACPHSGTRYQAATPMNITAMRSMRAHWPQMMEMLKRLRSLYLERYPLDQNGWTVAGIERLATLVMAVPTFQCLRMDKPVAQGGLHPVLASIFRVTDGLRMTAHQMLFVPGAEPNLSPDAQLSPREIYDYAERNYNFFSEHGVCAGPRVMIEEFLAVLLEGYPPRDDAPVDLDPAVLDALASADRAFDYGLLGLQVHFVAFSHWPLMARAAEALSAACDQPASPFAIGVRALDAAIKAAGYHSDEARRSARLAAYAALARRCNAGLPRALRTDIPLDGWQDGSSGAVASIMEPLRIALHTVPELSRPQSLAAAHLALTEFTLAAHRVLAVALSIQDKLNGLLGRAPSEAEAEFEAADMQIHLLIQNRTPAPPPHLIDLLSATTGLGLSLTRSGARPIYPHSADLSPGSVPTPDLPTRGRQISAPPAL
jgi:hypothetical protein